MSAPPRVSGRHANGLPVTSITHLPGSTFVLTSSGCSLAFLDLQPSPSPSSSTKKRWKVFERDRIHRINVKVLKEADGCRAVVTGGREAVLISIRLGSVEPTLSVLARFKVKDFVGDSAFLNDDLILLSTLHNVNLVYRLPTPLPGSSTPPALAPRLVLQAPLLPLLWCTRFSSSHYSSQAASGSSEIRLAGGTMWGDAYLWDVATPKKLRQLVDDAGDEGASGVELRRSGGLRRFVGHKGSIFSAAFSPTSLSPPRLLTASDDRTIRLFPLPTFDPSFPLEDGNVPATISEGESDRSGGTGIRETMWGHEGRVWRAEWLEDGRGLVSIGEDATLRFWAPSRTSLPVPSPSIPPCPSRSQYRLAATFPLGHDGRSIWSICPVSLPSSPTSTSSGFAGVLTGGSDGGVRYWPIPNVDGSAASEGSQNKGKRREDAGGKVKAFTVMAVCLPNGAGREAIASVTVDGSFYISLLPEASSSGILPSTSTTTKPFHHSPALFGGASSAVSLFLLPSDSASASSTFPHVRIIAMSNLGGYVSCVVTFDSNVALPQVHVEGEVTAAEMSGVRTTEVAFVRSTERFLKPLRAVVWDRASWATHLLDVPSSSTPTLIASSFLSRTSAAPTSLLLLSPSLILVGRSNGALVLLSLLDGETAQQTPNLVQLGELDAVHSDGVADLALLRKKEDGKRWEVETAGRDGTRCVIEVVRVGAEATMRKVDERAVVGRGSIEKIYSSTVSGDEETTYLALIGGKAVLYDRQSRALVSFSSAGKKTPSQLVVSPLLHSIAYYRLVSGSVHRSCSPSPLPRAAGSNPPAVLLPPLHGREMRDVKSAKTRNGRVLLATAAENGVLIVSELTSRGDLRTLYIHSHLPSSLKSLAWSRRQASDDDDDDESYLLFVSGSQELLCTFSVIVSTVDLDEADPVVRLRVLPMGLQLAEEGNGEVRTMGMAVLPLPSKGGGDSEGGVGIVAGYSDGSIKLWSHSVLKKTFILVASTSGLGKCVLVIDVVEVELADGGKRTVLVSGGSDGLVALRDLTSLLDNSLPSSDALQAIPDPFLTFRPHQSGVNALALRPSVSTLTVATGGDDNALSVQLISLALSPTDSHQGGVLVGTLSASTLLPNAHASTIQGLDFLPSTSSSEATYLVSSAVDQRLNIYSLASPQTSSPPTSNTSSSPRLLTLDLVESTCLEAADCGTQEIVLDEESGDSGEVRVVVAGIGVEVVTLSRGWRRS